MYEESYKSVEITSKDLATGKSTTYFIPKAQGFNVDCDVDYHYSDIDSMSMSGVIRTNTSYKISIPKFYPIMGEDGHYIKVYNTSEPSASDVWNVNKGEEHYDNRRNKIRDIWPELGDALDRIPQGDVG